MSYDCYTVPFKKFKVHWPFEVFAYIAIGFYQYTAERKTNECDEAEYFRIKYSF